MGRNSTGAWRTDECLRVELSFLLQSGYLARGSVRAGSLHWDSYGRTAGSVDILTYWLDGPNESPYIRLSYVTTDRTTGVKEDREEVIYLEAVPSNLGKGEVLYFICPSSGQRCRILYKAYNSRIWKSRQSYRNRIYYPSQQSSKLDYHNNRFWELKSQIKKMNRRRIVSFYRDKPTRRGMRLFRLQEEQYVSDILRLMPVAMPLEVRRAVYGNVPGFEYVNDKTRKRT